MTTHGRFAVRIRPTGPYADVWISYIIVFVKLPTKMGPQGVECGGMDWNELAQDRDM
jgi:hypothetical protein